MKLMNKTTRFIITLALMLSVGTTVFAEPTADSLNNQKQQLESQKSQFNQNMEKSQLNAASAQKEIDDLNMQIEKLDSKIEGINATINSTKLKITSKESEISVSQDNLDKAMEDIQSEQVLFNQRMRAMYIGGYDQYLSVLFSSKDFNELYTKIEAIVAITEFDNKLIKELSDKKEAIKVDQDILESDRNTLLAYKQDNEDKLSQVKSSMAQQQKLIAQAKESQAYFMSQISDYRSKVLAADKQVQDTIKQLQALAEAEAKKKQQENQQPSRGGGDTSNSSTPAAPNSIVAYAYQFLGTPYVWGGTTPVPGFDCSGFMQYVYAHFGIHITRTTYTQINDGRAVNRDQLQPGDLILFGTEDDPHHVGMYVGNGCVIHAPHTGDVIKISPLSVMQYVCARRILN